MAGLVSRVSFEGLSMFELWPCPFFIRDPKVHSGARAPWDASPAKFLICSDVVQNMQVVLIHQEIHMSSSLWIDSNIIILCMETIIITVTQYK